MKEDDIIKQSDSEKEEEEEKKTTTSIWTTKQQPSFIGKHAFPKNPFPPQQGVSSVFSTGKSLWENPFAKKVENSTSG